MNEVLQAFNLNIYSYEEYKYKIGGGFRNLVLNSFPEGTSENTIDRALEMLLKFIPKITLIKPDPMMELRIY